MAEETPQYESKLWSYLSRGDGIRCPLYDHCQVRQVGGWCPDDDKEHIGRMIDGDQFKFNEFDFIGHETRHHKIFKYVEKLARRFVKMGEVHDPPIPTELVFLADKQHPIEIRSIPLKVCHGATWFVDNRWIIQLKRDDTPAMKRFTLFHEAFHILAHCGTTPIFRKRGVRVASFNELLANSFAAFILMPKEWVKEKWAETKNLEQMVEIFNVPEATMCIRLKYLGLH